MKRLGEMSDELVLDVAFVELFPPPSSPTAKSGVVSMLLTEEMHGLEFGLAFQHD